MRCWKCDEGIMAGLPGWVQERSQVCGWLTSCGWEVVCWGQKYVLDEAISNGHKLQWLPRCNRDEGMGPESREDVDWWVMKGILHEKLAIQHLLLTGGPRAPIFCRWISDLPQACRTWNERGIGFGPQSSNNCNACTSCSYQAHPFLCVEPFLCFQNLSSSIRYRFEFFFFFYMAFPKERTWWSSTSCSDNAWKCSRMSFLRFSTSKVKPHL